MRFPVFLHGTTFMHAAGAALARGEYVRQVFERVTSIVVREFEGMDRGRTILPPERRAAERGRPRAPHDNGSR